MLNAHRKALGAPESAPDLYPTALRAEIDELNEKTYQSINNGAYKAGFSSAKDVYESACSNYFATLDELEQRMTDGRKWLMGEQLTLADVRLFPTLFRHDAIYFVRMKLNQAMIRFDYPHLHRWLCRFYQLDGVAAQSKLEQAKSGYFGRSWNNVIPSGPKNYPNVFLEKVD